MLSRDSGVLELAPRRLRWVRLGDAEEPAHDLDEGEERRPGAVGGAVAFEDQRRLALEPPPQLVDQPRLADPGLADDVRDAECPGPRLAPAARQHLQLLAPPHEGAEPPAHGGVEAGGMGLHPVEPVHALGLRLPLDVSLAEGRRLGRGLHQPPGGLGDENRAGLGEGLEAGREVHRVAHRLELRPRVPADGAHHDGPGVDADPRAGAQAALGLDLGAEGVHALLDLDGSPAGPERRVLQGHRGPEERQDAVARELLHRALVAVDDSGHQFVDAPHELIHGLFPEPLGHGRVALEVGEEHGHLPPLPLDHRSAEPRQRGLGSRGDRGVRGGGAGGARGRVLEGAGAAAAEGIACLVDEAAGGADHGQGRPALRAEAAALAVVFLAARAPH